MPARDENFVFGIAVRQPPLFLELTILTYNAYNIKITLISNKLSVIYLLQIKIIVYTHLTILYNN